MHISLHNTRKRVFRNCTEPALPFYFSNHGGSVCTLVPWNSIGRFPLGPTTMASDAIPPRRRGEIRRSRGRAPPQTWYIRAAASRNSKVSRGGCSPPGFRTLSWEMSSLNGARMASLFSFPAQFLSLPFSSALFSRCRRYSRKLWGNGFELSRGILRDDRGRERERVVEREGISGYGDFYVPILIHAATRDKTDGALLLKSHRVSRIRDAEIYESCRPARSPSFFSSPSAFFPFAVGGWFISERTRIIGGWNVDATFWRTLSYVRQCYSAR